MSINSPNYADLPLDIRLDILDKDEDFKKALSMENRWCLFNNRTEVYSDLYKITSADNNKNNIEKIKNLYLNLEPHLQELFLCGACFQNRNYLFFKEDINVTVQSYSEDEALIQTETLNPTPTHELPLAKFVASFKSDKYINSAWTPNYYTNDTNMRFTHRTPGIDLNIVQYIKKNRPPNIVEGHFPYNEVSSTLKIGDEYIQTIAMSALKPTPKSARSVI